MILDNSNVFSVGKPHNGLNFAPCCSQVVVEAGYIQISHRTRLGGPSNVLMVPFSRSEALKTFLSNSTEF